MKSWSISFRTIAASLAVTFLAACASAQTQPAVPSGGSGMTGVRIPNSTPAEQRALLRGHAGRHSWMEPGVTGRTLFYAGGDESSYVFASSGKVVGQIAETSFGTCSDRNGDVFFTQVQQIVEYAHGATTPKAIFTAPGTVYACSVDPTTGNLAAVVFCLSGCGTEVSVWSTPGDPVANYSDANLSSLLYCAYDKSGNLYVDGYNGSIFGLAELPAAQTAFVNYTVSQNISFAAQIQWDGTYVAVETKDSPTIYQLQLYGSTATVVGQTTLSGIGTRATQSWIFGGKVAVPTAPGTRRAIEVLFWKYPGGGYPVRSFSGFIGKGHAMLDGVTLSKPPK
jgi:hypothetical protein